MVFFRPKWKYFYFRLIFGYYIEFRMLYTMALTAKKNKFFLSISNFVIEYMHVFSTEIETFLFGLIFGGFVEFSMLYTMALTA